jgi:hypothetical protein
MRFDEFARPLDLSGASIRPVFRESSPIADAILRLACSGKSD